MKNQEFFAAIKETADSLTQEHPSGFLYVTSVKNFARQSTAGTVAEVSTRIAARHILNNTGRISTEAEITEHLAQGRAFASQMNAMNYRHAKHPVIHVIAGENNK